MRLGFCLFYLSITNIYKINVQETEKQNQKYPCSTFYHKNWQQISCALFYFQKDSHIILLKFLQTYRVLSLMIMQDCDMIIDDLFPPSSDDIKVAFIDDKAVACSDSSKHVPDGETSLEK